MKRRNWAVSVMGTVVASLVVAAGVAGGSAAPASSALATTGVGTYTYDTEWVVSDQYDITPQSIAVDSAGRIFVLVGVGVPIQRYQVRIYGPDGTLLNSWEPAGLKWGSEDMLIEPSGNLLITDDSDTPAGDARVNRYSPEGRVLTQMNLPADNIAGLGQGPDGTIWVTDGLYDNQFHRMDADGTYRGAFGTPGVGPGEFDGPTDIAVLPDGNLAISEADNARVQVVTPTGEPVRMWGQSGSQDGQFSLRATEVVVGPDGYLYVLDASSAQSRSVQVFTPNGEFVARPVLSVAAGGQFQEVRDIAFGVSGELLTVGRLGASTWGVARYLPGAPSGPAPSPSPTAEPTPSPSPSPVPVVRGVGEVGKRVLRVKKRRLVVPVVCPAVASGGCVGTVRVKSRPKSGKARVLTKSGVYELVGSARGKVRLRVTKKGLRLLRSQRKAVVILTAEGVGVVRAKVKIRR